MIRYGLSLLGAAALTATAQAAALSPAEIVARHNAAVANSDVDAMMIDYADDAVVIEAGQSIQGKPAIRALFVGMFPKPAAGAPPSGAATMKITRRWQEGEVGFFNWELGTTHGTDGLLVRGGKIEVQSVFINEAPRTPAN